MSSLLHMVNNCFNSLTLSHKGFSGLETEQNFYEASSLLFLAFGHSFSFLSLNTNMVLDSWCTNLCNSSLKDIYTLKLQLKIKKSHDMNLKCHKVPHLHLSPLKYWPRNCIPRGNGMSSQSPFVIKSLLKF